MSNPDATCWTMIEAAAAGRSTSRERFVGNYREAIEAYLGARWRQSPLAAELNDAVQDVFLECFRDGGLLQKVESGRGSGFRAFLFGAVRNVARRFEERHGRASECGDDAELDGIEGADASPSRAFDQAWARALLREAAGQLRRSAADEDARRRVELLDLRFREGLPIRDIAARWQMDAERTHREYARARREFRRALEEVVRFHQPEGSPPSVEAECQRLLAALGGD